MELSLNGKYPHIGKKKKISQIPFSGNKEFVSAPLRKSSSLIYGFCDLSEVPVAYFVTKPGKVLRETFVKYGEFKYRLF